MDRKNLMPIGTGEVTGEQAEKAYRSVRNFLSNKGELLDYVLVHGSLGDLAIYQIPKGITAIVRCKNTQRPHNPEWRTGITHTHILLSSDVTDVRDLAKEIASQDELLKLPEDF